MAEQLPRTRPGTATVTDRRPVPRGVLPRGVQTWLMAGIAVGMLAIMFVAGDPSRRRAQRDHGRRPRRRRVRTASVTTRTGCGRSRRRRCAGSASRRAGQPSVSRATQQRARAQARPATQIRSQAERKRREYESLFASNVVLSRRPESERPDAGGRQHAAVECVSRVRLPRRRRLTTSPTPSFARRREPRHRLGLPAIPQRRRRHATASVVDTSAEDRAEATGRQRRHRRPDRCTACSKERVIDTVLTNRLDGSERRAR